MVQKFGLHLTWDLQAGIVLDHQANCDSFLNGIGQNEFMLQTD